MIKTELAYRNSKKMIEGWREALKQLQEEWRAEGKTEKEIDFLSQFNTYFALKIEKEIAEYEAVQRGDFDKSCTFENIGKQLIRFRIWKGLSQADLAERLGVSHQQVARDERNEYQSASRKKIQQVLDALGIEVTISPTLPKASGNE